VKNVTCVIPSRMSSSRFPGKPLVKIRGRELILRVCDIAAQTSVNEILVATEDKEIADIVERNGYKSVMTGKHPTCTHRVCEVAKSLDSDYILNLQGDEPCVDPELIDDMIKRSYGHQMVQATYPISQDDLYDEDCVKAVVNNGKIIYLTRNPEVITENLCGIAGIYVYDNETISNFDLYDTRLVEAWRGLDTFAFIGIVPVVPYELPSRTHAVDRPTDVVTVESNL